MTQDYSHPVAPPPELVQQWHDQAKQDPCGPINWVAVKAAQWGADQELEACCEWEMYEQDRQGLRKFRRPKPPSLKEQALMALEDGDTGPGASLTSNEVDIIRRALEALSND